MGLKYSKVQNQLNSTSSTHTTSLISGIKWTLSRYRTSPGISDCTIQENHIGENSKDYTQQEKPRQQIVKPDTDQRTENTNCSFHKYQSNTTKNSLLKIVQTYYTVTFDHLTEFKYIQSDNFLSLLNKLKTLTKVIRHIHIHTYMHTYVHTYIHT